MRKVVGQIKFADVEAAQEKMKEALEMVIDEEVLRVFGDGDVQIPAGRFVAIGEEVDGHAPEREPEPVPEPEPEPVVVEEEVYEGPQPLTYHDLYKLLNNTKHAANEVITLQNISDGGLYRIFAKDFMREGRGLTEEADGYMLFAQRILSPITSTY